MPSDVRPFFLANRPERTPAVLDVRDKFTREVHARVALAGPPELERAIAAAHAARGAMRALASCERRDVLLHCVRRFEAREAELAETLCAEAGKPIRDARGEVGRLIDTFRTAAEEATRIGGEVLPLDVTPRAKGYRGLTQRVPAGACAFVTPFNFPLNLAAHKVAPAIAAGCPFVLKPASATPLGALLIGETLAETGLPPGAFSILPLAARDASPLVEDERFALLSFTGSPAVGWDMKRRAGRKKVVLELGGNAACVVDEGVSIDDVVARLVFGAWYQSGQSCIKTQRILVHRAVIDELRAKLVPATEALVVGDPRDERTFVGPLVDESEAVRLERWIASARARGAKVLCGGERDGALLRPTILEDVPEDEPLVREEAFGPVAVISTFERFDDALAQVDRSRFGLQAGVFTNDWRRALRAWDTLDVGGVILNDVPSWRVDSMPYGGEKESGFGREGVRYAIETMTSTRLLVIRGGT